MIVNWGRDEHDYGSHQLRVQYFHKTILGDGDGKRGKGGERRYGGRRGGEERDGGRRGGEVRRGKRRKERKGKEEEREGRKIKEKKGDGGTGRKEMKGK